MQKILLTLTIILLVQFAKAQQTPIYTQHQLNGYLLNPAKAGVDDNLNVFMLYRNQWTGMPNSPETTAIIADGAIKGKKMGLGLNMVKDVANIIGQTSGMGTFSYFLDFSDNQSLSMGLSVGFTRNEIYFDRIKADNVLDPSILYSTDSKTNFDADFGLNYRYKELEIGLITKHLPATTYLYEKNEDFKALNYQLVRHFIINAQYKYSLPGSKLDVIPNLLLKSAQGLPIQYEISALAKWNNQYWVGVSYKEEFGFGMYLGLKIHENILVSYAYEHSTGKLASYTNASHEVMLGFVLDQNNKKSTQTKSKQKNELNDIIQLQSEELDRIEQENQKLIDRIKNNEENINNLKEEIDRSQQNYLMNKDSIEIVVKKYKYDEPISKEEIEEADKEDQINPSSYYVVVGATFKLENARLLQKILKREKQLETKIISREDNKYLFVYTNQFDTRKEAVKELQRLKKMNIDHLILGNIWIYKN